MLLQFLILWTAHFVGDFVLQTDEQARGKSEEWRPLVEHTFVYTMILSFGALVAWSITPTPMTAFKQIVFMVVTFVTHTGTDYVTSRINRRLYEQDRIHDFFVGVGADQLIHAWTLAGTWWLVLYV